MYKQHCSRKHICLPEPNSKPNLMNIGSLLSPPGNESLLGKPETECANLLGSFLFRDEFKCLEYFTKRFKSSLKTGSLIQDIP